MRTTPFNLINADLYESTTITGEKKLLLCPAGIPRDALFRDVDNGASIYEHMATNVNAKDLKRKISIIRAKNTENGLKAVEYLSALHAYLDGYEEEYSLEDYQNIHEILKDDEFTDSETVYPVITVSKVTSDLNPLHSSALAPFSSVTLQGQLQHERRDVPPYYRNQAEGPIVVIYNEMTMPFTDLSQIFEVFSDNRRVYIIWEETCFSSGNPFECEWEETDASDNDPVILELALKYNASVYFVEDHDRDRCNAYLEKVFIDLAAAKGMRIADDFKTRKITENLAVPDGFTVRFLSLLLDRIHETTDIVGDSTLRLLGRAVRKSAASVEESMPNLDSMIGMTEVKEQVYRIINTFRFKKERSKHGIFTPTPNTILMLGPAGTGKTETAKALANMAYEAGVISRKEIISCTGTGLCGEFLGQTRAKVEEICRSARGGVLFIDEAYSLSDNADGRGPDLYSGQAIAQLLVEMDHASIHGDTIIILAGYEDKMMTFLNANPGLRSRCSNRVIRFKAYSADEAADIYFGICRRENLSTTLAERSSKVKKKLVSYFSTIEKQFGYGNGRTARNLVLATISAIADRVAENNNGEAADYNLILPKDVLAAVEESLKMMGAPDTDRKINILA